MNKAPAGGMQYKEFNPRMDAHRTKAKILESATREYAEILTEVETLERYLGVDHPLVAQALEMTDKKKKEITAMLAKW